MASASERAETAPNRSSRKPARAIDEQILGVFVTVDIVVPDFHRSSAITELGLLNARNAVAVAGDADIGRWLRSGATSNHRLAKGEKTFETVPALVIPSQGHGRACPNASRSAPRESNDDAVAAGPTERRRVGVNGRPIDLVDEGRQDDGRIARSHAAAAELGELAIEPVRHGQERVVDGFGGAQLWLDDEERHDFGARPGRRSQAGCLRGGNLAGQTIDVAFTL